MKTSAKQKSKKSPRPRINKFLKVLTDTCYAKGWAWKIESIDERDYQFATISFDRTVAGHYSAGSCDLTLAPFFKIKIHKSTPFNAAPIDDLAEDFKRVLIEKKLYEAPDSKTPKQNTQVAEIESMLRRFHRVANQLTRRHEDRSTLEISDEYDVQDLLHAILRATFDDVREEEPVPSSGGASSRMDFLLVDQCVVVEAKFATPTLRDKKIGEQIIVDISRYQAHPSCKHLMFLVYDPNHNLKNPEALEKELSGKHKKIDVKVVVNPK